MLTALHTISNHMDTIWCVTVSKDGKYMASCSSDKTIRIYEVIKVDENGIRFGEPTVIKFGHERTIRSVAFSPCGRYLLSTSFDSTAIVWLKTDDDWEIHTTLEGHENEVKCGAWSSSGQFVATCSRDKSVWVWEVDEEEDIDCCSILQQHSQDVKTVVFHPSINMFVSCSYDNSIKFYRYDLDDWIVTQGIEDAHKSTVWSASFNVSGKLLATSSHDGVIKIWRNTAPPEAILETSDKWKVMCSIVLEELDENKYPVYTLDWLVVLLALIGRNEVILMSHLTHQLAAGCADGAIRIYQPSADICAWLDAMTLENSAENAGDSNLNLAPNGQDLSFSLVHNEVGAHPADINAVKWHSTVPGILFSAGDDRIVKVWRLQL